MRFQGKQQSHILFFKSNDESGNFCKFWKINQAILSYFLYFINRVISLRLGKF